MVSKAKDFVGRRSLSRADSLRADRKQLVGLLSVDPKVVLPEGAQIVERVLPEPPMPMLGHVTSSYWSENLQHSIALALVSGGRERHGQEVSLPLKTGVVKARICEPLFYDPAGERMNG